MKSWLKLPSFWAAVVVSLAFLMFGLPNLFGPGSGLIQWAIAAAWIAIAAGLWIAVYKGAQTLRDAAHSLRDQGRDIRK
jgi:hypothetical protein